MTNRLKNRWHGALRARRKDWWVATILFTVGLAIYLSSPIQQFSDSKYTLVVSESLLRHRSFAIDYFAIPRLERKDNGNYVRNGRDYQLEWVRDRLFFYHPPGTSVLSVPYVAAMHLCGLSVINSDGTYSPEKEIRLQAILAGILMSFLIGIFYFTSRLLLPTAWSVAISLGGGFGTQAWSTLSRGLWSDTWGVLLLAIAILMLFAAELKKANLRPALLGTLLAWTYFVRPTYAIAIVGIAIYVLVYYRRAFTRFVATGLIWFALFIAYSEYYFRKLLPNYYLANRLSFNHFGEAIAGNLFSPARGLLVYVPVVFFILYLLARFRRRIVYPRLVVLSLAVVVMLWLTTSGFPHWWGGSSYGPRLLGGVVPWLALLAILGVHAMLVARLDKQAQAQRLRFWRTQNALGSLLLLISIFINAMGATMDATITWNERPVSVDKQPARLWDWHYPQFLAGILNPPRPDFFPLANVRVELTRRTAEPYLWYGWSVAEESYRWTDARKAAVIFELDEISDANLRMKLAPLLMPGKLEQQRMKLSLNGQWIETKTFTNAAPQEYSWELPKEKLQKQNVLILDLPDAATPKSLGINDDPRKLALAVSWLEIQTAASERVAERRTTVMRALPDGGYAAEIVAIDPPAKLKAGESASIRVKVKNVSGAIWPAGGASDGTFLVRLGNHWRDANGVMIILDDGRVELPYDLRPGREIELPLTIRAPQTSGNYTLELDMVQERVTWFADENEDRIVSISVAVQ